MSSPSLNHELMKNAWRWDCNKIIPHSESLCLLIRELKQMEMEIYITWNEWQLDARLSATRFCVICKSSPNKYSRGKIRGSQREGKMNYFVRIKSSKPHSKMFGGWRVQKFKDLIWRRLMWFLRKIKLSTNSSLWSLKVKRGWKSETSSTVFDWVFSPPWRVLKVFKK